MVASKAGADISDVANVFIWGNHSSTQYPDVRHATVGGQPVLEKLDREWLEGDFIAKVQKRGAAIIEARKLSSAMSAAKAIADHMRDWVNGTSGKAVSMAVFTDEGQYGVPPGICFSLPCTCADGKWSVVDGLAMDDFSSAKIQLTLEELTAEKVMADDLLKPYPVGQDAK
jgi:malate/lactate dehydrogenase